MCSIEAYDIVCLTVNYYASSGGGISPPDEPTTDALVSLGITLNIIETCLKSFKKNYIQ